ncbi:MAG: DUF4250 domain-containing protein [bacterium]
MIRELPKDPYILLIFINSQLRYNYDSLDAFCEAYNVSRDKMILQTLAIDYRYDPKTNQFR